MQASFTFEIGAGQDEGNDLMVAVVAALQPYVTTQRTELPVIDGQQDAGLALRSRSTGKVLGLLVISDGA